MHAQWVGANKSNAQVIQNATATGVFTHLGQNEAVALCVDELSTLIKNLNNAANSSAVLDMVGVLLEGYNHRELSKLTAQSGKHKL